MNLKELKLAADELCDCGWPKLYIPSVITLIEMAEHVEAYAVSMPGSREEVEALLGATRAVGRLGRET